MSILEFILKLVLSVLITLAVVWAFSFGLLYGIGSVILLVFVLWFLGLLQAMRDDQNDHGNWGDE